MAGPLRAQVDRPDPAPTPYGSGQTASLGSYDVAPVRILGIPAISVAAPVISRNDSSPDARQRAEVIEGNLSLLYAPRSLCEAGEGIAEMILEGLVLGGPPAQHLCSGDPWAVLGKPEDLHVVVSQRDDGEFQLQAHLKGRAAPMALLSVTEADAQLHGLDRGALAERWRQVLQRRLRHARHTEQPSQIALRLRITVVAELLLGSSVLATIWLWTQFRRRVQRRLDQGAEQRSLPSGRDQMIQWGLRGLFLVILTQLVLMVGLAVGAVPGRLPLAITLLLQPFSILLKIVLLGACALALRLLTLFVLRQWVSNLAVPTHERARRLQRYLNLRQVSQRVIDLGCLVLLAGLVLADIPGIRELTLGAWLAGGALLGGLAIAFQGLLRDGLAGLVALLDDHYAVGDVVEVNGVIGTVVDVGLLVTELRTADQRVVLFTNASPQHLVNHTKNRSGIELLIPLAEQPPQLEAALAVVERECRAFAEDPHWQHHLLMPPLVRGVKRVVPGAIELSVVLTTRTGSQWEAQRCLLRRLVVALQQADIRLACAGASTDMGR
ncbi:MAG: mechanosensitive ion channel domain-containing protein [Synechococcaceae cyanobacterium]|nr:mechanosensitive ion channel domain-containing protein [Synechococcaceae cyanobacterium]